METYKTLMHGNVYLTQLQYIINLLFKIAQPFNGRKEAKIIGLDFD